METIKINLATFEYQDKRLSYPVMLLTAAIVLVLSVFAIRSGLNNKIEIKEYEKKIAEQDQNIITRQRANNKENVIRLKDSEIESLKKEIDFINGLIDKDAYPYDRLLDSLELYIPEGIVLSSFRLSNDLNKVVLEGKADSMNEITVFLNKLSDSKIYNNNSLLSLSIAQEDIIQEESISMDDGIGFEIECSIDKDQVWINY